MNIRRLLLFSTFLLTQAAAAQPFTRQDSLRGENGRGRDWWDVKYYWLSLQLDPQEQTIGGEVWIDFKSGNNVRDSMQIDLQEGLLLDSARFWQSDGKGHVTTTNILFQREHNVYWLFIPSEIQHRLRQNAYLQLRLFYHGKPRIAKNPPWDGGFIWSHDGSGKPWIAVACQGLGASAWWPCKDYQGDEPDRGILFHMFVPDSLGLRIASNGHQFGRRPGEPHNWDHWEELEADPDKSPASWSQFNVRSPINLYNVTFYIGDYIHWTDTFKGEKGTLPLDFYALRENEQKARKQFAEAKPMLRCFEYWLGPYPFYEDGYKLVEAPYLGMEHQSAVAYGNQYKMGYLGRDLSNTGEGLKFDFIIIHESGHEWFGNNITAKDVADNWIHEGLCSYTEVLYLEWIESKEAAYRYMEGRYANIGNKAPVIGPYGVNKEGEDIYNKGAAILHMVRLMMNDDKKFRLLLRGMNKQFYHQTITTKQVEDYIGKASGLKLGPFFNIYLRDTAIPTLQWYRKGNTIHARWLDAPENFIAPVTIQKGDHKSLVALKTGAMKISYNGAVELKASGLYHVVEREYE